MGMASDFFGLDTTAGDDELKRALAAIQGVRSPTKGELTLPELEQYVEAGLLSPEQYQAILANPEAYNDSIAATQDNSGSNAQKAALQQLSGIVNSGGSTAINEANLRNNIDTTNQAMKGARGAIQQNAQERGVSGGGLEFISQLMNEQSNADTANRGAVQAGADNAKLALEALTQSGQMGGQMQGQANQMSQAQAEAAQQIAQYNSQLQSQANQYNNQQANQAQQMNLANAQDVSNKNVGNANMRTQYNTQLPQQIFQNDMTKAGATADAYGKQGALNQQQAQQDNAFTGNLMGTGAQILGTMYGGPAGGMAAKAAMDTTSNGYNQNAANQRKRTTGYAHGGEVQCYAEGGEVHDHQICMAAGGMAQEQDGMIPGDHPENDVIDAKLSPGEIVLPRSVAQSPNAPQQAEQFVAQEKGMGGGMPMPNVGSFAEVLAKLEENGIELRLAPKAGM